MSGPLIFNLVALGKRITKLSLVDIECSRCARFTWPNSEMALKWLWNSFEIEPEIKTVSIVLTVFCLSVYLFQCLTDSSLVFGLSLLPRLDCHIIIEVDVSQCCHFIDVLADMTWEIDPLNHG